MSRRAGTEAGFTLLEMLVVIVVVGLALAMVANHGPRGSVALDLKGSAAAVSDALRLARSRAVATNRPVRVVFDLPAHAMRSDGASPQVLSAAIGLSVTGTAGNVSGNLAAISFAPDGSSSGGRVELAEAGRRIGVGVDWLTGRVSVGP